MYDIITFGSAAQDIHLKSKAFKTIKDHKDFVTGSAICLNLGSKVDVDDETCKAIALATFIDQKYSRFAGGYKKDTAIDLVNYIAALADKVSH